MQLFQLKDYVLTFEPQILSIQEFDRLFKRDKSKTKDRALKELSYIYFMCDFRSDYSIILNLESRHEEIKKALGLPAEWKADIVVREAMEFYKNMNRTMSMELLKDAEAAVGKISAFLRDFDPNERDQQGKLVMDVTKVTTMLDKLPNVLSKLRELKNEVRKDVESAAAGARGSISKNPLEDA